MARRHGKWQWISASRTKSWRCARACGNSREGEGYRLRGTKHFISNGGVADFVTVFAKTDMDAGHRGISAFVVERDTPGGPTVIVTPLDPLGSHALHHMKRARYTLDRRSLWHWGGSFSWISTTHSEYPLLPV